MGEMPDKAGRLAELEGRNANVEAQGALYRDAVELRAILDAMPDCVKIFDHAGELVHINAKGLQLLEAHDLADLSRPGYVPVPEEHIPRVIEVHRKVMAGEPVVWSYEVVGLAGSRHHVEAHSVPFVMPDG